VRETVKATTRTNAGGILVILLALCGELMGGENMDLIGKKQALEQMRQRYSGTGIRASMLDQMPAAETLAEDLGENGVFNSLEENALANQPFMHLWRLAHHLKTHPDEALKKRVLRGVLHYGKIETSRPNNSSRFHDSCFAIPQAIVNVYFFLYDDMARVETGQTVDPLFVDAHTMIRTLAMQCWTQPFRNDATDSHVVQVERFRKHVWWVGGNAISYRPVFETSILMNSVEMLDVIATVAKNSLTAVSQTTYDDAFWTEGITADGAGWGHGKQCLVWGYPRDGAEAALRILAELKGTPWEQRLDRVNIDTVLSYIRGSSWYFYKGYIPPCVDRTNMNFQGFDASAIRTRRQAGLLLDNWAHCITGEEQEELRLFLALTKQPGAFLGMAGQPAGRYSGTRWFYNNDDLIAKNESRYVIVNMASSRCDGLESANRLAAGYNYFTADGQTLYQRSGDEYGRAIGAWNLTAVPGVTARQGEDVLKPIENWRGFKSQHNFAAAATRGQEFACAGFVFEKQNGSWKDGKRPEKLITPELYDIKATKGYFLFGDTMVCLGAGIANKNPDLPGTVWTTIDQTRWSGAVHVVGQQNGGFYSPGDTPEPILVKPAGKSSSADIAWVIHKNAFAYGILPDQTPGAVHLSLERRMTKWKMISGGNRNRTDLPPQEDILQLWIDHDRQVENDTYGYVVWLGAGKVPARPSFRVLANAPELQAITSEAGVTQAIVYNAESQVDTGQWKLKASSPCALMVEEIDNRITITVCDALMDPSLKGLSISTTLAVEGDHVRKDNEGWNIVQIELPQGQHCGSPVTSIWNKTR
jgi:chondroitin AC lyase